MIHSTHDSIHDFDFAIQFDSRFYLNKIRFKTFYYCLDKMHVSNIAYYCSFVGFDCFYCLHL